MILMSLLAVEIIAVCKPCLLHAKGNDQATDILVYSNLNNSNVKYLQSLEDGILSLEDKTTFKIKAKIEPVTESRETVFTRKILAVDNKEILCIETPCQKKWKIDLSEDDIDLMELPHLQLAWKQEIKGNTPKIYVSVYLQNENASSYENIQNTKKDLNKKNKRESDNQAGVGKNKPDLKSQTILLKGVFGGEESASIIETSTVDLEGAEYVEKSRLYLAKREYGFDEDQRWRYIMDGSNLVLQSRVDVPLKDTQALKLYHKAGSKPVRVSLSIDKDGDMDRDLFIQFEQMDKSEYREYGKNVLSLDFNGALKNAGVDIEKGHLLEAIIFMPQDIVSYKRDKPLEKIIFGVPENKTEYVVLPKISKADKRVFLDFDFGKASSLDQFWGLKVKRIVINADFKLPQLFTWEKIMLFDAYSQPVPSVLFQPGLSLQKWTDGVSMGPHEYVTSFKPLLYQSFQNIEKKPINEYKPPEIINSAFHDKDIEIEVSDTCSRKAQAFIADDPVVNNQLLLIYHGNKPLKGNLDYFDKKGNKKSLPVFIPANEKVKYLNVEKGSRLLDFRAVKRFQSSCDISFMDFKAGPTDTAVENYRLSELEWWDHKGNMKLKPASNGIKVSKEDSTAILYKSYPKQNQWVFILTLGEQKLFKLDNLTIDHPLPFGFSETLIINGKTVDVDNDAEEVIALQEYLSVKTLLYKINSQNNLKIFQIKIPEVNATVIKHTAKEEADHLKIKIGNKTIPLSLDLLFEKNEPWITKGEIVLGKGNYFIEAVNSKYFRVKSLMLETDTPLTFQPDEIEKKENGSSLLFRLLMMGVKFVLFAGFVWILYLFRLRIKSLLNFVWSPFQKLFLKYYWVVPDEAWVMLWLLGGVGLYGLGLLSKSQGENYATTFAGIFMVVFFWHLGRLMKGWLLRQFPKIAITVYRSRSTPFFAWAIVLLVITALLVAAGLEPLAEQTAIVVYYCLVVGVVGELRELSKDRIRGFG